uniref:Uncharacterized protein n=1 Tax=Euplotes crassus TaxID=5936 RepID=A0A7S3KQ76_EUPCR|mmetsp:Transcript_37009/g.36609  ORF Transcript_37009/g.36609 Transcript_37009/m.36609 type:complete len:110 (+) Transcript_37009:181-510(+)
MSSAQEDEHAQLLYLAKENKVLQQEFRDLNLSLNKFIEMMKDFKYKNNSRYRKINQSMRARPKAVKIETKLGEKQSYELMIENMRREHRRLRDRLDVVGDPSYSLSLRK